MSELFLLVLLILSRSSSSWVAKNKILGFSAWKELDWPQPVKLSCYERAFNIVPSCHWNFQRELKRLVCTWTAGTSSNHHSTGSSHPSTSSSISPSTYGLAHSVSAPSGSPSSSPSTSNASSAYSGRQWRLLYIFVSLSPRRMLRYHLPDTHDATLCLWRESLLGYGWVWRLMNALLLSLTYVGWLPSLHYYHHLPSFLSVFLSFCLSVFLSFVWYFPYYTTHTNTPNLSPIQILICIVNGWNECLAVLCPPCHHQSISISCGCAEVSVSGAERTATRRKHQPNNGAETSTYHLTQRCQQPVFDCLRRKTKRFACWRFRPSTPHHLFLPPLSWAPVFLYIQFLTRCILDIDHIIMNNIKCMCVRARVRVCDISQCEWLHLVLTNKSCFFRGWPRHLHFLLRQFVSLPLEFSAHFRRRRQLNIAGAAPPPTPPASPPRHSTL